MFSVCLTLVSIITDNLCQLQGTIPFMAIDMLIQYVNGSGSVAPSPAHNLESLIYIFVWICVVYSRPGQVLSDISLQQTCVKGWTCIKTLQDVETLCNARTRELTMKFFLNYFTPYFKQLKGPTSALYNLLHASCDPNSLPLTHEAIKKILLQAFFTVKQPASEDGADAKQVEKRWVDMYVTEDLNDGRKSCRCRVG